MSDDAAAWKAKGNTAFSAQDFPTAIEHFTKAIELDASNHVLYSNRSASHASLKNFASAQEDAAKCVSIKPDWAKGYVRLGAAYHGLEQFEEAIEAYESGLKIDPSNESLKTGLSDVQDAAGAAPSPNPFAKIFGPDCIGKIAANPKLQAYLAQPDYIQMIQTVQKNPEMINSYIQDQRMMQTFMVLSGINLPAEGAADAPAAPATQASAPRPTSSTTTAAKKTAAAAGPKKSEAQLIKEEGNAHYKKREFEEAIAKYQKAADLEPTNTIFLLNMTAVIFEQGKYDECIEAVEKALAHGQEHKAEYQTLVKLTTRKGACLQKKGQLDEAITLYKSALLEWRNPDTLAKLDGCQKEKKETEAKAYLDPALALEHKDKGNAFFKVNQYPDAVKEYSESIKRDPSQHATFSNRAACYIKLGAFEDAIKDCDTALAIKPDFVRAHYRKGNSYFFSKRYTLAMTSFDAGLKFEPENEDCLDGKQRTVRKIQEMASGGGEEGDAEETAKRAMHDPEVAAIMNDSYMQLILQEMQKDPKKLNEYMQDANIAAKINKLVSSGILRMGGPESQQKGQQRR